MKAEFAQLERVFSLVSNAPRENWQNMLDELCPDKKIKHKAYDLLNADSSVHSLLDQSLYPEPEQYREGDIIGNFKLQKEIGRGGMGVVYVANQIKPVRRKVALKVIKPGVDTREVIARFDAERQALSMMDHPNIAKVLGGGSTESGHPYFVMELVEGKPVTHYCDDNKIPYKQRLELFLSVCHAIQHAHQKGVIHRDIKPSNVLVAEYDGRPVATVIDFGVAKAIHQPLTAMTVSTRLGQVVGTYEYMSPEQTHFNRQMDVDTRSDIYSLGVLVYELLTGKPPFRKERLRSVEWEEMLRIIRDEDPPKPSVCLSEASKSTVANQQDQSEIAKFSRTLRGELDWIVMKAIEKDRDRRYRTPTELADDIERYLQGEPVLACPPSTIYRFKKYAKRNKVAIATSAIVVASLILGIVGTSWQALRAMQAEANAVASAADANKAADAEVRAREIAILEREKAEFAEAKATEEAALSRAVSDFLEKDLLSLAGPESQLSAGISPDPDLKLVTILERALVRVDERFENQPVIKAKLKTTLANSFSRIGRYDIAVELLEEVYEYVKINERIESLSKLYVMNSLATNYKRLGRLVEASNLFAEILESNSQKLGVEHPSTLSALNNMAGVYLRQKNFDKAQRMHNECFAIRKKVLGDEHPDTVSSMLNLAIVYQALNRFDKAEKLLESALEIQRRTLASDHPKIAESLKILGVFYHDSSLILNDHERLERAGAALLEAIQLHTRLHGRRHPASIRTRNRLAQVYKQLQRYDEAVSIFKENLEIKKSVYGDEHISTIQTLQNLGSTYRDQLQFDKSKQLLTKAYQASLRTQGAKAPITIRIMNDQSLLDRRMGNLDESIKIAEDALTLSEEVQGLQHPETLATMVNLAGAYLEIGRTQEAITLLESAVVPQQYFYGRGWAEEKLVDAYVSVSNIEKTILWTKHIAKRQRNSKQVDELKLARVLRKNGLRLLRVEAWEEAERSLRESVGIFQKQTLDSQSMFSAQSMLGEALAGQNRFEEAKPFLIKGYEGLISLPETNLKSVSAELIPALDRLVGFYDALGESEQAAEWRKTRKAVITAGF